MRTAEERSAARAVGDSAASVQERLDLGEPGIDPDQVGAALREQVVPEAAAPVELERETAEVAQQRLAGRKQRAAFAAERAGVWMAESGALGPFGTPADERRHRGRV
jgi:hypothetical protein